MGERKMKKFLITLAIVLAVITIVIGVIFAGLGFYLSPQTEPLKKADAIVVVSGGQTTTRAQKGIELYKDGKASEIIFSGAALDDGPSNATAMRNLALEAGVPDSVIYTDQDSKDTYQNAVNTKRILDETAAKSIILVTSPYHQRRAYETFRRVLGDEYTIYNSSSLDNRWSKSHWWNQGFSRNISINESAKLFYILVTGNYK